MDVDRKVWEQNLLEFKLVQTVLKKTDPQQIAIRSQDYDDELLAELKNWGITILKNTPTMFWLEQDKIEPSWANCIWRDVKSIKFSSITDAQKKLRELSKTWNYHSDIFHRRGALIAEKFKIKNQPTSFDFPIAFSNPYPPVFTMAAQDMIYYSQNVQRPTVDGKMVFNENKTEPPSRAYLKLWEALTVLGDWPKPSERVVDLGSSPGSWSWALAKLQAQVISIDRSELSAPLMKMKNIEFQKRDAFSFKPVKADWVFSDIICFPEKLYDCMKTWRKSGLCKKFVCNVKFKGDVDPQVVNRFRKIPHSRVIHLLNAKKEVTWICHPSL